MKPRVKLALRLGATAIVLALVGWYGWKQDWRGVLAAVRHANPWWLAAVGLGNVPLVFCKARRTRVLLAPTVTLGTGRLMRIFFASYAADNLLMSHAGVGVRVALIRRAGVPWATSAALQALEKALEAMGIAGVALVVELWPTARPWPAWIAQPLRTCFWLGAGATVIALALVLSSRRRHHHADRPAVELGFVRRLGEAAIALRRPGAAVEVALWSTVAWAIELAMVLGVLRALALPADVPLAALVVLAVNVAALIPGLPANVGPFEASAMVALGARGIVDAPALGVALVYHLLHTLPVTAIGLRDLRRAGALTTTETVPAAATEAAEPRRATG